jgi:hypothetical protein
MQWDCPAASEARTLLPATDKGALEPQVLNAAGAMLEGLLDDLVEARAGEQADQRQRQVLLQDRTSWMAQDMWL